MSNSYDAAEAIVREAKSRKVPTAKIKATLVEKGFSSMVITMIGAAYWAKNKS